MSVRISSYFKISDGVYRSITPVYSEVGGISVLTYTISELLTTTGAGTWTKPNGVTDVTIECWGAGGGGGGSTVNGTGGAGGGGGAYAKKIITYSSAVQSISYTVGVGGTTGTGNGGNGGDSFWETNVVLANGGAGGATGTSNGVNGGNGGTVAFSVGDVLYKGGDGQAGWGNLVVDAGCGGGGGAGSLGPGGDAVNNGTAGGIGTSEFGGNGGIGNDAITSVNGSAGSNYGGGGSGAYKASGANRSGGVGAQGLIRVSYSIPPPMDFYTGSIVASSVRKLSNSATYCMEVERDSDNTAQLIGFQPDGLIDTGSLLSFCGSATGYVNIWINQVQPSGSFDFKWSGPGWAKPYIVSSGSLVLENGKPCVFYKNGAAGMTTIGAFGGVASGSDELRKPIVAENGAWMTYAVAQVADTTTRVLLRTPDSLSNTNVAQNIRRNTTNIESIAYNQAQGTFTDAAGTDPGTNQFIAFVERKNTTIETFVNGATNGATTTTGTPYVTSSVFVLGYFGGAGPGTFPWSGSVQEIVHYPLDATTFSNYRAGLTAAANSFYGTY